MNEQIEHELEENPALKIADGENKEDLSTAAAASQSAPGNPDYISYSGYHRNNDSESPAFSPRDNSETLTEVLERQIAERSLNPDEAAIAEYIVGNLDSNGWLTRSIPQIVNDLAINRDIHISEEEARKALEIVQSLDPPGIGGLNLADTLLIQLRRLPESQERNDAIEIISNYFKTYSMRHSHKIISGLRISQERLDKANKLIKSLNPKPGTQFGGTDSTMAAVIIPDFVITACNGDLTIRMPDHIPELAIEESFSEAMRELADRRSARDKGHRFISSNYNNARDFIQLVKRRRQTMMGVMTAIADFQKDYFDTGDLFALRPMSLKDIASATGLDISTVSRATMNKYVQMPWGKVISLKSLFSGRVNAPPPGHSKKSEPSEECNRENPQLTESNPSATGPDSTGPDPLTNIQIQAAISGIVAEEDQRHPLSDEKLREVLRRQGYDISRRTIAKYRDRAGIPVARLRKKF